MTIQLPDLPYPSNALAPHISEQTINFHYGKHHAAYVTKTNAAVEGTDLENASLEDIIRACIGVDSNQGLFNNAAQVWNHSFYWACMSGQGGGQPGASLAAALERDFGSVEAFKDAFAAAAAGQFGSGWAWLVEERGKLKVTTTANADLPMAHNQTALLTIDVWEHAYYLDYQNARPTYIETFLDKLVNWDAVEENLQNA